MRRGRDEGPSEEDMRRYGHEADPDGASVFCHDCGAPMHHDAEICPKCFCYTGGDALRRSPQRERARRALTVVVILLLVIALLAPLITGRWWL
jgi:predicted nucleic acid-binding Zn ribbon protein